MNNLFPEHSYIHKQCLCKEKQFFICQIIFLQMPLLLLILFTLINNVVTETEVRINSVDGFVEFTKIVNDGTNYLGTTVFLDSDLDLAGKTFEPIGNSISWKYFRGVLDGQGHAISNLEMTSDLKHIGIFGY